ncbi:hypothetical protein, partial [Neisseria gonorrhoeae]|uniref:hypothetical protein n=1 Tax=Neisseria gonorrhoeae TaxID=485 RepID=UPI001E3E494F
SASTYTLVVTPAANSTGNLTVDVSAGAGQDAAGNLSLAAAQAVQAYDTKPVLTPSDEASGVVLTANFVLTFDSSETMEKGSGDIASSTTAR